MKNFPPVTTISVLLVVISSSNAQAATFTEIGDAGETLLQLKISNRGHDRESISGTSLEMLTCSKSPDWWSTFS